LRARPSPQWQPFQPGVELKGKVRQFRYNNQASNTAESFTTSNWIPIPPNPVLSITIPCAVTVILEQKTGGTVAADPGRAHLPGRRFVVVQDGRRAAQCGCERWASNRPGTVSKSPTGLPKGRSLGRAIKTVVSD